MAPKDIYTSSRPSEDSGDAQRPRRAMWIWWTVATPAERWSAAFVVFAVSVLIGILLGIAWYQSQQLRQLRERAAVSAAESGGRPSWRDYAPTVELDVSGRLRLDELDEAKHPDLEVETPRDLSEVSPEAIMRAAVALKRAERAAQEGDWATALEAFEAAAQVFPDSIRIREQLGLCQLRERNYAGAAATFRWLSERRPQSAGIWNNLGVAEAGRDRFEDAQGAFERALALDPSHPFAPRNLAVLAFRRGDMSKAAEALMAVLRRDPEDHEAALMCAVALLRTGRFTEAVSRLEDLAVRFPSAPVWFHLAEARARLGQNGTALQALDRAVAMIDARTAVAWLNRPELDGLRRDPEFQRRWSELAQSVP